MHLFVQLNDILDYMKGLTKTFWASLLDECEPCGAVVLWEVLNFPWSLLPSNHCPQLLRHSSGCTPF